MRLYSVYARAVKQCLSYTYWTRENVHYYGLLSLHVVLRIINKLYNQGRASAPPVFIWKMNPLVIPVTSVKFRRHLYQFRETELVVARGVWWEIRKQRRETTGIYCFEKLCETVFRWFNPVGSFSLPMTTCSRRARHVKTTGDESGITIRNLLNVL